MYIFVEPVTGEQIEEIQTQNASKIEAFEREVLGLSRRGSQDNEGPEWDDIAADVANTMHEDEESLNRDDGIASVDGQLPLQAEDGMSEEDQAVMGSTADDSTVEDEYEDEEDEEENEGTEQDEEEDDQEQEGESAGNEEDSLLADGSEVDVQTPSPVLDDATSASLPQHSFSEAASTNAPVSVAESSEPSDNTDAEVTDSDNAETDSSIESEPETTDSDDADTNFLEQLAASSSTDDQDASKSRPILGFTLTIRNKVNDKYVLRPEGLFDHDNWTVEYSVDEIPSAKRARTLYEACKKRREQRQGEKLRAKEGEGTPVKYLTHYMKTLREMSVKGREWRKEMDEKERRESVKVLGHLPPPPSRPVTPPAPSSD